MQQDRNDVTPIFTSLPRPVRLRNNIPVGQMITTLTAVDTDGTAPNNQVCIYVYNILTPIS